VSFLHHKGLFYFLTKQNVTISNRFLMIVFAHEKYVEQCVFCYG